MLFGSPVRRLARLVDAAAEIRSTAAAALWCAAIDAETDKILTKARILTAAAMAKPTPRAASRIEAYERAVCPELDRAAEVMRLTCAMYFADPPSASAH